MYESTDDIHKSLYGDVPAIFTHIDWKRATKTQISEREWHRNRGGLLGMPWLRVEDHHVACIVDAIL